METTTKEKEQPVWMSYEESEAHRKLMHQREQEWLRQNGLGWIIEFCSPSNKKENGV